MTLKKYLDRIANAYKGEYNAYKRAMERKEEISEEIRRVMNDLHLSYDGKRARADALKLKLRVVDAELAEIKERADTAARAVIAEGTTEFERLAMPNAGQIGDTERAEMELIRGNVYRDTELIQLARRYGSNAAMLRVISDAARQRGMTGLVIECNRLTDGAQIAAQTLEDMRAISARLCGETLYPIESADTLTIFANRFDEMTAACYATAAQLDG